MSKALTTRRALSFLTIAFFLSSGCGGSASAVTDAAAPHDASADVSADVNSPPASDIANDGDADSDADTAPIPTPELWPSEPAPEMTGAFCEAHPELAPWSRWHTTLDWTAGDVPDFSGRGAFGLGNGRVFALMGLADPANTLHSMAGPTYEQGERFFGDLSLGVTGADDSPWDAFDKEWVIASFGAPVLRWRGVRGALEIETIDLVPWPSGGAGDVPAERRAWLRVVLVRNTGDSPLDGLALELHTTRGAPTEDGAAIEETRDGRRLLSFFAPGAAPDGATAERHILRLPLPSLAPGAEERRLLVHATSYVADDPTADRAALADVDVDALLRESADALQSWWSGLVELRTPDPAVDDLVRALAMTLKVQTTAGGATAPMSNYTRTWTRDNVGPVFGLLALGAHEDAGRALDYYWRAVVAAGGLQNSYPCDLDPTAPLPDPPDWDALPTGAGRTAAEAPSYIPMMYGRWTAWTGDLTRVRERLRFLRYTLASQTVSPEGLFTWSGDETFRAAMNAAFGLLLENPIQDTTWSLNSSLVFVAGARALMTLADALGDSALRDEMRERADTADAAAMEHLTRPEDGCLAAFIERDSGELSPPFEDANLKELWAGTHDGDDPVAADHLACLIDQIGAAPGVLQSPLDARYAGQVPFSQIHEGIYTGMLPGYTLAALTLAGHPEAEDAFNAVQMSADGSGSLTEYMIYDDHSPLQIIYNPDGAGMTDYSARFRPWEGGIVLDALLGYLVGLRPDALADAFTLRPHLPNGWPTLSAHNLRVADARFDLDIERESADTIVLRLHSRADRPFHVTLRWDVPTDTPPTLELDGETLSGEKLTLRGHFAASSAETQPLTLPPDGALTIRIQTPRTR